MERSLWQYISTHMFNRCCACFCCRRRRQTRRRAPRRRSRRGLSAGCSSHRPRRASTPWPRQVGTLSCCPVWEPRLTAGSSPSMHLRHIAALLLGSPDRIISQLCLDIRDALRPPLVLCTRADNERSGSGSLGSGKGGAPSNTLIAQLKIDPPASCRQRAQRQRQPRRRQGRRRRPRQRGDTAVLHGGGVRRRPFHRRGGAAARAAGGAGARAARPVAGAGGRHPAVSRIHNSSDRIILYLALHSA